MYKLLGAYLPLFETYGFLQPVFTSLETALLYYQIVNNGIIEKFERHKPKSGINKDNFFYIPEELHFNEGNDAAYFFRTRENHLLAGSLEKIKDKIVGYLNDPAYNVYEKLEIATELQCWGYINNLYFHNSFHNIKDSDELQLDDISDRNSHLLFNEDLFEKILSETDFITKVEHLAQLYHLRIEDFLVYQGIYAIAGFYYIKLSHRLLKELSDTLIDDYFENLGFVDEDLAIEIFKSDKGLINKLKIKINNDPIGVKLLESLSQKIAEYFNLSMALEKQKTEFSIYKSSKKIDMPQQDEYLKNEVGQMAEIIIRNRCRPELV